MSDLLKSKLDLVRCFMEIEGDLRLVSTIYKKDGGVEYSGYKNFDRENKHIKITIDKSVVKVIDGCKSIPEIYDNYIELEFF